MELNDLPLLELFTKLREAGLPLGIEEYQLVLQAMQAGFGINDQAALKRLCQTLWVKSSEELRLFEYYFEQVMDIEAVLPTSEKLFVPSAQPSLFQITRYVIPVFLGIAIILGIVYFFKKPTQTVKPPATVQLTKTPNWIFLSLLSSSMTLSGGYILFRWLARRNTEQRVGQSTFVPEPTPSSSSASSVPAKLMQIVDDEVQVAQAVLQATSKKEEIPYSRFILTTEYFPVTERQMKQTWRYLRRPVREGIHTELDLEATVNQIGHQGLLLEPVLVPRRVNRSELLLLIDQDGSMVPFHTLSHRLAETAWRGGRLGKAGIYYFHNCPIEYLYHDPNHQEAELINDIVTNVCSNRTVVLIFSDAGAARGGYSEERYQLTKKFFALLKQQVHYVAWLNPMPRKRWVSTTSEEIARLVPMFEFSSRGFQDAIGVLRGRLTNF